MEARREYAIDGLRAVAVLLVVGHHAGIVPFALGTRGVDLFFVISGFCLSLPSLRRTRAGTAFRFDLVRFARDRAARIIPPYYAALALFVFLSFTSFGLPSVIAPPMPFEWLQNAAFITKSAPAYNASFWTLGVEALWYVLFPAILTLYVRSRIAFASLGVLFYLAFVWHPELTAIGALPCFMLGIVAADVYVRGRANARVIPIAAAAFLIAAIAVDRGTNHGNPLWHLAAFFSLLSGLSCLRAVLSWSLIRSVGVASYSIYLVHQPIVIWLEGLGVVRAGAVVLAVFAGFVFWAAIEKPSLAWRASIKRNGRRSTAALAPLPTQA